MKYGARNRIPAKVTSVEKGDVMSLVKLSVVGKTNTASVPTTESLDELALKPGEKVELVVKALHVLVAER